MLAAVQTNNTVALVETNAFALETHALHVVPVEAVSQVLLWNSK